MPKPHRRQATSAPRVTIPPSRVLTPPPTASIVHACGNARLQREHRPSMACMPDTLWPTNVTAIT